MKPLKYIGLIIFAVSIFSACTTYNYYKAGADNLSLSRYKTFAWLPNQRQTTAYGNNAYPGSNSAYFKNDIAVQKIKQAAIASLESKGLRLQNNHPDLLVRYSTLVDKGTRVDYYSPYWGYPGLYGGWGYGWGWGWHRPYWGFGWGWGYPYGGPAYADEEHFKEGTIVIDLIDTHTRQIIWRGFGVGELHHNPEKTINDLPKVVDGIFKQLPVNNM
jgi:hypothetical protein